MVVEPKALLAFHYVKVNLYAQAFVFDVVDQHKMMRLVELFVFYRKKKQHLLPDLSIFASYNRNFTAKKTKLEILSKKNRFLIRLGTNG